MYRIIIEYWKVIKGGININQDKELTIFIISDSIGETAETVINTVISQFKNIKPELKKFTNINTLEKLTGILNKIKQKKKVIVIYTIVLPKLNTYLKKVTRENNIPAFDIIGSLINTVSNFTEVQPQLKPGLNHKTDQDYFKKISCIEFAVTCDDGQNPHKLKEADIVLIGVSRTSKTPLSIYLAHHGFKVANIPLIQGINPPKELYNLPPDKVIGLVIDPTTLREIRQGRLRAMQVKEHQIQYTQMDRILEELNFAEKIMKEIGCMIIDVTNNSIEETANKILTEKDELTEVPLS